MKSVVTLCRLPSCRVSIPEWKLMCAEHWYLVPKVIQRRVSATLGVYRDRGSDLSREQYLHAVDDAVHAVRVALDKKVAAHAQ